MPRTAAERILKLAAQQSLVRPRDVAELGMARETLLRLYRQGLLIRPARGVYSLAEASVTEHHSLAVAAKLASSSRHSLPSVGTSVPRPHNSGPTRDLDCDRFQSPQAGSRVAGA
jgi:predicted transcriptional regulator of viral defense system